VLNFSRNFGHQIAITAGFDYADGDAVIVMDADLQDPPEVLLRMIAKWREGYDVAYAVRTKRAGETEVQAVDGVRLLPADPLHCRCRHPARRRRLPADGPPRRAGDAPVAREEPLHARAEQLGRLQADRRRI
jgi:glycosyltransferase involved in cell wall biosynthesis